MLIMRWMAFGLALLAAAVVQAPVAQAAVLIFATPLSGPAEFPPNTSPGTGEAVVFIDDVLNTMTVQATFAGLIGTTIASHIHCCTAVPGTGTVGIATETPTFSNFPLGVQSGKFSQTYDLLDPNTYNPPFLLANNNSAAQAEAAFIQGLEDGRAYLNIHTTFVRSGEIRGFLAQVPEPSSLLLLTAAFCGMIPLVRRRNPGCRT